MDELPSPRRPAGPNAPAHAEHLALPGRFRAAVFDLDGLLIDSEPGWGRAETELFRRHGFVYTAEDRRATLGQSIDDAVVVFAHRFGLPDSAVPALRRELTAIVREEYAAGHPKRPGAFELVERLRGVIPLAVASNTDRDLVEAALEASGSASAFQAVVTAQDVERPKPAPDLYLLACARLGVPPAEAIAFEDSATGAAAAKAAGLTVVLVPQLDGLSHEAADVVLESLAELSAEPAPEPDRADRSGMQPDDLARPLIGAAQLAAALADPGLRRIIRPVDVRWKLGAPGVGRLAYASGHLPGAAFLDLDADLADADGLGRPGRHPLPEPAAFARTLSRAGIADDSFVVAYDDAGGTVAARLWWMLDALGHDRAAVLDGGIQAWQAAGFTLTTEPPDWPPGELHLGDRWSRTVEREALRSRLGRVTLLDVRAGERYRGEIEPVDPVPGHIPTAVSAPTTANLAPDGRHLPPDELARRFERLGAADAAEVVVYCGSGVNACHAALAMRLAGLPDPIVYPGSYSDWSRSGLEVATGPGGDERAPAPARDGSADQS